MNSFNEKCFEKNCDKISFQRGRCIQHYSEMEKLRTVKDGPLWPYAELLNRVKSIPSPFDRAMFALTYLIGARKGEVVEIKRNDIWEEKINETDFFMIKSPVLKNRTQHSKLYPINRLKEKAYVDIVFKYANTIESTSYLFPSPRIEAQHISREYLTKKCYLYFDFNPHWFRKLRNTHLRNGHVPGIKPVPTFILQRLNGWSDERPSKAYDKYSYTDTARFME